MPIQGIAQPEYIQVNEEIRLRRYDGVYDFAFSWYQDPDLVYLVDGVREPYSWDTLQAMYEYLNGKGELYFIEALQNGAYVPIGDVTFWQQDMPIVIGEPDYRGRGIGRLVVQALVRRGLALGYDVVYVNEIYHFNKASRHCFESVGFHVYEQTENAVRLKMALK